MAVIRQRDHGAVPLYHESVLAEAADDSQAGEEEEDVDELKGDDLGLRREIGGLGGLAGVEQVRRKLAVEVAVGARVDHGDAIGFEAV